MLDGFVFRKSSKHKSDNFKAVVKKWDNQIGPELRIVTDVKAQGKRFSTPFPMTRVAIIKKIRPSLKWLKSPMY